MKNILLRSAAVLLAIMILGTTTYRPSVKDDTEVEYVPDEFGCSFYDGEGRKIPVEAVKLLVRSEFVYMKLDELDTIQKYFYFKERHICPFIHCPMKDQVRFQGCGNCTDTSDCYKLDMIHWEHPTWTYDECADWMEHPLTKENLSIRYTPKLRY